MVDFKVTFYFREAQLQTLKFGLHSKLLDLFFHLLIVIVQLIMLPKCVLREITSDLRVLPL